MKKIISISTICIIIDQFIKWIVTSNMDVLESIRVIPDFFSITHARNFGAAFSILSGNRFFLIGVAVIAIAMIYIFLIHKKPLSQLEKISYGLLYGGIIGNLFDRMVHGYVIDYFDFVIFGYDYPIFNIADTCIVFAVLLMMISLWKEGDLHGKNNSN